MKPERPNRLKSGQKLVKTNPAGGPIRWQNWAIIGLGLLCAASKVAAQNSYTINTTTTDAFLASGSPGNPHGANLTSLNFGGAGTLAIAPAASPDGEFDSIIKFNSAAAVNQFNTTYGAGNWTITGLTLSLASNFGVQGAAPNNNIFNTINAGSFGINWLSYNGWTEGAGSGNGEAGYPGNGEVSFNSISTLLSGTVDSLGTYTYTPPGNNIYLTYNLPLDSGLVTDAAGGGDISLYFYAADNQVSYLFNSRSYAQNHPELTLTVAFVPEPSALAMAACGLVGLISIRCWKIKK
jgi:hypothetical protein